MRVRFLDTAEAELHEAIDWYEAQAPGLGDAFLLEVVVAVERIVAFPEAWQSLGDDVRRCRLARFPYGLIYAIEDRELLILAVAHLHRKPQYWRDRSRAD